MGKAVDRVELTSQWIENWQPKRRKAVADRRTPGLVLRGGPRSKVFHTWRQEGERRRMVRLGAWPVLSLDGARKMVHKRGEAGRYGSTVGDLLDAFAGTEAEPGQCSGYTGALLRKHLEPLRDLPALTLPDLALSELVAKVQRGYRDNEGKQVGGPAVADKVRGGLRSMFAWAQRRGYFPKDRPHPAADLIREDFEGIGWEGRERAPSERELHELFDALGVGRGEKIEIDVKASPRISEAARLAVLLLMHAPVRSGVGILARPASAADLEARVLRWHTRKGEREADLETPLSTVAVDILKRLAELPGGKTWLVPSPKDPKRPIGRTALAHLFDQLHRSGRIEPEKGRAPVVPHTLRALWRTLAGDLGIHDGVAVRVLGHKPEGASAADPSYDHSRRVDLQREAVERVSAELERVRRRQSREAAAVVPLAERAARGGA